MDLTEIVMVALLIGFAAAVQGTLGFGYAMVLAPLAALVVGAETAIATSILTGSVVVVFLYAEGRPRAPLRSVAPLVVAALVGLPLGLALLATASETMLRLLVGVAVLLSALLTLASRRTAGMRRPERLPQMLLAGMAGGVTLGAVSMNGPPVLLYQHWIGGSAEQIRGRMLAFLMLSSLPGAVLAALTGLIGSDVLRLGAAGIPAAVLGMLVARTLRPRLDDEQFAQASMALLALTSAAAIGGALTAML